MMIDFRPRRFRGLLHGSCLMLLLPVGCSAVPTRPIDCASLGQCEPLQFVFGQSDATTNNRLRHGLASPSSAILAGNKLFVADTGFHRVLIWNSFPPTVNQPPDVVLGQPDLNTAQANYGGLSARTLAGPTTLASNGTRLVVGDTQNHRILIWNTIPAAHFTPADVVLGQRDFATAMPPAAPTGQTISGFPVAAPSLFAGVRLTPSAKASGQPMLIASDPGANRLLIWDPLPMMNGAAATGAIGQTDYTSGAAGISTSRYNAPSGSATLEAGQLSIADSQNHRVVVHAAPATEGASAPAATVFLGQVDGTVNSANRGAAAPTRASLNLPIDVAAVGRTVYVVDARNNRVMIWNDNTAGSGVDATYVLGQSGFTTATTAPPAAATLSGPRSVWSDNTNTLVADTNNHRVLLWGKPITAVGQAADRAIGQPSLAQNQSGASPTISASELSTPAGLCSDGVFLVADTQAHRVLYWPRRPLSPADAPTLVLGQSSFTTSQPLSNGLSASSLYAPTSVTCQNGNVAIADYANHRVLIFTRPITSMAQAADVILGQPGATTNAPNNGGAAAGLSGPFAVHMWGGTLYVADSNNHRVLIWNQIPDATQAQKPPDLVLGQSDLMQVQPNGGLAAPTASTMRMPLGIHHDGSRLYVADSGNHRVLVFHEPITTSGQAAEIAIGQANLTTGGGNAVRGNTLGTPIGVAVAGDRLYITDADNHRVLYFRTLPMQSGQIADGVLGQPDFMSRLANAGGLSATSLQQPYAILPTSDALYIADYANGRIVVTPPPP